MRQHIGGKFLLPELNISAIVIVNISLRTSYMDQWHLAPFFKMIPKATMAEFKKIIAK